MGALDHQFAVFGGDGGPPGGLPPGWSSREVGQITVAHGPHLPVEEHGGFVVLGWHVWLGKATGEARDAYLRGVGRFVVVTEEYVLCDPGGNLASLRDEGGTRMASSQELIEYLWPGQEEWASDCCAELKKNIDGTGTWYPAGLSKLKQWRVALPNRRLDWGKAAVRCERVWNGKNAGPALGEDLDLPRLLRQSSEALAEKYGPVEVRLTGGRDSRMILSALRKVEGVELSVSPPPEGPGRPDVELSTLLAELTDLPHRLGPCSDDHLSLYGYGGFPTRFQYEPSCCQGDPLPQLGIREGSWIAEELGRWREDWAELPKELLEDMAYLEMRMANSTSFAMYRDDGKVAGGVDPFNGVLIYEAILAVSREERMKWGLPLRIIGRHWNQLLLLPFQKRYWTGREKVQFVARLFRGLLCGDLLAWRLVKRGDALRWILAREDRPFNG